MDDFEHRTLFPWEFENRIESHCNEYEVNSKDVDSWRKHRNTIESVGYEVCSDCGERKPLPLTKLCCLEILNSIQLTKVASSHLPPILLDFLLFAAVQKSVHHTTDKMQRKILMLLDHIEVLDMSCLSGTTVHYSFIADLILKKWARDLEKTKPNTMSKLQKFIMYLGEEKIGELLPLHDVCPMTNYVFDSLSSLLKTKKKKLLRKSPADAKRKYIIVTNLTVRGHIGEIISVLHFCRRIRSPFELRITKVEFYSVTVREFCKVLKEINVQYLESVTVINRGQFTPTDIGELENLLAPCSHLHSLRLEQLGRSEDLYVEPMADAMSSLLSHFPNLKQLQLCKFVIATCAAKYQPPQRLERLCLRNCTIVDSEWQMWASKANSASIKVLWIDLNPSHSIGKGFVSFIERHARTLVKLRLEIEEPSLNTVHLRHIAQHLAPFGRLAEFFYKVEKSPMTLEIVQELVQQFLVIQGLDSFILETESRDVKKTRFKKSISRLIKAVCKTRTRPIGTVWIHHRK